MTKRQRRLPETTLLKLGRAAIRNVYAYFDDIEALLADDRHVRAFALQVLAGEEFAKAFWVDRVLETDDEEDWSRLWGALGRGGRHQERLAVLLALEAVVVGGGGKSDLSELMGPLGAHELFDLRNAALYVDLNGDNDVSSPEEFVAGSRLEEFRKALAKAAAGFTLIIDGFLEQREQDDRPESTS